MASDEQCGDFNQGDKGKERQPSRSETQGNASAQPTAGECKRAENHARPECGHGGVLQRQQRMIRDGQQWSVIIRKMPGFDADQVDVVKGGPSNNRDSESDDEAGQIPAFAVGKSEAKKSRRWNHGGLRGGC